LGGHHCVMTCGHPVIFFRSHHGLSRKTSQQLIAFVEATAMAGRDC
jgi:hypothetical protein